MHKFCKEEGKKCSTLIYRNIKKAIFFNFCHASQLLEYTEEIMMKLRFNVALVYNGNKDDIILSQFVVYIAEQKTNSCYVFREMVEESGFAINSNGRHPLISLGTCICKHFSTLIVTKKEFELRSRW
ncbi:hypothetical protein NIES4074_57100 [Cylindrospermum sp. NIES-4074]|nr:hypothetical protein NIES4074_57100 [Cylindrospermum sp. NIES-4074]